MGKILSSILCVLLLIIAAQTVNASIVNWNCADDGDGGIVMGPGTWTPLDGEYKLNMGGTQYFYPAHVQGDFQTDTELDPTVWLIQQITNDTDFAWTDYHITIGMDKNFSISTTSGIVAPDGWDVSIIQPIGDQPLPGDISPGIGWVGTVNFVNNTGAPINIGEFGDFGFKFSFLGTVNFWTAQVPTPEPTTILLLGLGAMSVIRKRS